MLKLLVGGIIFIKIHSNCLFSQDCTDPLKSETCGVPYGVNIPSF